MQPNDRIYLLGQSGKLEAAEDLFSNQREAHSICIVGGGVVGTALAQQLASDGVDVLIIEKNRARAYEIGADLQKVTVVCGDGTDLNLLQEERVKDYDLFVAASREDEVNLMGIVAREARWG